MGKCRAMAVISLAIIIDLAFVLSIALALLQRTTWWAGYDLNNCAGCQAKIDWTAERAKPSAVGSRERSAFRKDGVAVLRDVFPEDKVAALADEVDNMPQTFMTDVLARFALLNYLKYEHKLDTRSELVRDWAVHSPLGKWAAELMGVKEVRLYNAEAIYHKGKDSPVPCGTAWHRDTVAAPFPTGTKSITINVYLDDIGADAPHGDALIYVKGSHRDLESPPNGPRMKGKNLIEPKLSVGDILAHDPHSYHTPSGRGCWRRRSLQFRYVEAGTSFSFGPNRFPHGPVPWTLAHAPGVAPHGLAEGDALGGPWYPQVYPEPLESEHIPIRDANVGAKSWGILSVLGVAKEAQETSERLGIGASNCSISGEVSSDNGHAYFGMDGPVIKCEDWEFVEGLPLHKKGQMRDSLKQMMNK
uniref:Uncharacterized protein n=1 Tax=Odontella aurita TaxID=265563 RepID=A0A7S4JJN7_9STRA|mmetsp:Transcript_47437/g.143610  ORF Transcript_47437/g.143610 Transcript_47437/m.143610 type:complete len:416 (+) Transcript_47437:197-1444(+)|eukprot:CAMPEP_0113539294 /NCGR_PEP_ID=MMETSP0015_2-20120614/7837_1 /TAXON_ID=2838 /ORGANISM="Odontella" /LENGTH=415 /DNA_ID=CAMNT_0000438955 /DNA_START=152 /DNA_END=1399 /DNA_ORIENTATION=- /assembly_acc=CAM_ASM_000160